MKKKQKRGYKLSKETNEKLKVQAELRKEEEEKNNYDEKAGKKVAKKQEKLRKKEEKRLKEEADKISLPKAFETIFCLVYLGFLLICIWNFFSLAGNNVFMIFGCLATVLFFGDSFHLIPRIMDNMKKRGIKNKDFWFGLGTQISSITMTWFYFLLYLVYKILFPENWPNIAFDIILYITIGLRIIICLLPQNDWYSKDKNMKFSIIRNLIFLVTGIMEIVLFARIGNKNGYEMWRMALAIAISFAYYLPVCFGAKKNPKLGMLMIPKTLCYVWMLIIGLDLIGKVV